MRTDAVLVYVVIGILAFVLGGAVTVFSYRIRKLQQDDDDDGVNTEDINDREY